MTNPWKKKYSNSHSRAVQPTPWFLLIARQSGLEDIGCLRGSHAGKPFVAEFICGVVSLIELLSLCGLSVPRMLIVDGRSGVYFIYLRTAIYYYSQSVYLPSFCLILLVNIFNSGNLNCMAIKPKRIIATVLETPNSTINVNRLSLPIVFSNP